MTAAKAIVILPYGAIGVTHVNVSWSDAQRPEGAACSGRVAMAARDLRLAQIARLGDAQVQVTAHATRSMCEVSATVVISCTYICSRCLKEFEVSRETSLRQDFYRGEPTSGAIEAEALPVVGDDIVLDDVVREACLLEFEAYPVCRDDCQGLCPRCGIDRNEQSCQCVLDEPDERLAPLGKLLSGDE